MSSVRAACQYPPRKILGPTLVALTMSNFHFKSKVEGPDYFLVYSMGVCQIFYFSRFYANLQINYIQISIYSRKIKQEFG